MTDDEREVDVLARHNGFHEPSCDCCFLVGRIQRAARRRRAIFAVVLLTGLGGCACERVAPIGPTVCEIGR